MTIAVGSWITRFPAWITLTQCSINERAFAQIQGKGGKVRQVLLPNIVSRSLLSLRGDAAKAEHIYLSIYHSLSDEAHNGLLTLYIRQLDGKDGIKFALYREEPRNDPLPLIDLVASIVTDTTVQIQELLCTNKPEEVRELQSALAELRKGYKVAA